MKRKRMLVFCVTLFSMCLMASCGAAEKKIVLPRAEHVSEVTIDNGRTLSVTEDAGNIAGLLQRMGTAQDTGRASIQDCTEKEGVLRVDFAFRQGGASTVFLYKEGDKVILEQPYQGIYEADKALLDFLWEMEDGTDGTTNK